MDLRVKGTLTRIQAKLNLENLRKVIGLTCIVIRNGRAIENDTFYGASLAWDLRARASWIRTVPLLFKWSPALSRQIPEVFFKDFDPFWWQLLFVSQTKLQFMFHVVVAWKNRIGEKLLEGDLFTWHWAIAVRAFKLVKIAWNDRHCWRNL